VAIGSVRGVIVASAVALALLVVPGAPGLIPGRDASDGEALAGSGKVTVTVGNGNNEAGNNGVIQLINSLDGRPIVTNTNLRPGAAVSGSVSISAGPSPAAVTLSQSNVAHGGPSGSSDLSRQLQLTIVDNKMGITVYSGPFSGVPSTVLCGNAPGKKKPTDCMRWDGRETHVLTFSVVFPHSSGNTYQGTSASAQFDWVASK
jgi:hypothetical protein